MRITAPRRHAALVSLGVLVACGGTVARTASAPGTTRTPAPVPAATDPAPAHLWLLQPGPPPALRVVDARARQVAELPAGVVAPDWSRLYTVSADGGNAIVVVDPASGARLDRVPVDPFLVLPDAPGLSGHGGGLSPDGRYLVLTGGAHDSDGRLSTTVFSVFDTAALHRAPNSLSLPGAWYFDGIDVTGRNLYMIHPLAAQDGSYEVRRYDLVADRLDSNSVARKSLSGAVEGPMTGTPLDRVSSSDGRWQYTVYAFGGDGPFVHALDLTDQFALCIDLPRASGNGEQDLLWSLALSHDGSRVWTVNAATGNVVEIRADQPMSTPRTATLPVQSASASPAAWWTLSGVAVAEAKRAVVGGAAVSPDDATLYAIAEHGVAVIDTATLTERRLLIPDHDLQSIRLSPDGRFLYAFDAGAVAALLQIDTVSGAATSLASSSNASAVLRVTAAG